MSYQYGTAVPDEHDRTSLMTYPVKGSMVDGSDYNSVDSGFVASDIQQEL